MKIIGLFILLVHALHRSKGISNYCQSVKALLLENVQIFKSQKNSLY